MKWVSKKRTIIGFVLPSFVFFTLYLIYSIFVAGYYSLTNYNGVKTPDFVGLANYFKIFQDNIFLNSLKNTGIILIITILILLPLSFLLAALLDTNFRGQSIVKAMTFTPYIIAPILVGTIWMFILDPKIGLVNGLLCNIGLDSWQQDWIGGKTLTPYSVGIVYTWQSIGFYATIFLAGLKTISRDLYEVASVEGANFRQRLLYITIPLLKETIIINMVLMITGALKIFEIVYQLTNGEPNHLSDVVVTYMYYITFKRMKYGEGMAIAMVILIISVIISFAYIRNARKKLDK